MSRNLPTKRLTAVLLESVGVLQKHQALYETVRNITKDWGQVPPDVVLEELRNALDNARISLPMAIPDALAYLKANGTRLRSARNRASALRGAGDKSSEFTPNTSLLADPDGVYVQSITVENIEARLASLNISSEDV